MAQVGAVGAGGGSGGLTSDGAAAHRGADAMIAAAQPSPYGAGRAAVISDLREWTISM